MIWLLISISSGPGDGSYLKPKICYLNIKDKMSAIEGSITSGNQTFWGQEENHAWQRQNAENTWNNYSLFQRIGWWFVSTCLVRVRQPKYGAWPNLIGTPGVIPGTRVPFNL
jgi:hypothetical protein